MAADNSRKPSGSSTHSGAHSPLGSPGHMQSQRKLNPSNMYGIGLGNAGGLKPLSGSSDWQVWSDSRNPPITSAASVTEMSASQGDQNHRSNITEGWAASRSTSGSWDEVTDNTQRQDFSHMNSLAQLSLQQGRQRQGAMPQPAAFSGPRTDDRSPGSKNGQFSPQRYDSGHALDANASRYSTGASSTGPFGSLGYPGQQTGLQGANAGIYESLQLASVNEDSLSSQFRGMAVEDEFTVQPNRQHVGPIQSTSQVPHLPNRGQPTMHMPPQRVHYNNTFPQPDFAYYPVAGRDGYVEYPYFVPMDPSMYASPSISNATQAGMYQMPPQSMPPQMAEMFRQQQFLDYNAASRPPGGHQFMVPPQGVYFPQPNHSPIVAPQMSSPNVASLGDKKREMQYNVQQQLVAGTMNYAQMRSTPSPHPQAYGPVPMDFNGQIPLMMQPPVFYGHSPQATAQIYHHHQQLGSRPGRRADMVEGPVPLRSPLLEEFRANKARKWELRDIEGYVVEFSGDQHGSRFIQQRLEVSSSEDKQSIFDEIHPDKTLTLMFDVFGNYVIQKLFEHGTQVQKSQLARAMEGHVYNLAMQMYGCRVVQKAIEYILPEQQSAFVRELDEHVLACVKDANGNHVIQKLIERVPPERLNIVNNFRGNVHHLATHPYGCRVLQRCLEHIPNDQTGPLFDELHKYINPLMKDQFGNYVIQFVLEHGRPQDKAFVISKMEGHMLELSRHKFASNVCEKALVCADPASRRMLIEELITPKTDGASPIVTMMKDQFANYVLQRALAVVEGEQKETLVNLVRPQLTNMRRYTSAYSKHLVSIERSLEKLPTAFQKPTGSQDLHVTPP